MRRFFPIMIVFVAVGLFLSRSVWLEPLQPRSADGTDADNRTGESGDMATAESDNPGAAVIPAANTQQTVTTGKISRGTSFFVEMQKAGVTPVSIHRIVESSRGTFNFKRVKAGQEYSIFSSDAGQLDSMHFAIDRENVLKVNRDGDAFATRIDTLPYEMRHYLTAGTINSSIFNSLAANEADVTLASHLAVIFQWDVDFFKDIRKGDTYSILYERKVFENGDSELGRVLSAKIYTQGEDHHAFLYRTAKGTVSYYDEKGKSLQKSLLKAPLRYSRISSNFTYKRLHPVTHTYKAHLGVDYVAPVGTPVYSTGDGTVVAATYNRGNGNYVKIRHNSRYTTYYLHLKGFAKGVRSGRRVRQGQVIGYLGSTGLVNGPHLDYRIKVGGKFVNPRRVKLPSKNPVPAGELPLFEIARDSYLVKFFEAQLDAKTILVERPTPPMQQRLSIAF